MSSEQRQKLAKRVLDSRRYRHGLTGAEVTNRISHQLRAMLRDRGWEQQDLARESGIAAPLISNYVRGYQKYSLETLKKLARAFDTSLVVGFAPFSETVDWIADLDPSKLAPPGATNDLRLRAMSRAEGTQAASSTATATPVVYERPVNVVPLFRPPAYAIVPVRSGKETLKVTVQ